MATYVKPRHTLGLRPVLACASRRGFRVLAALARELSRFPLAPTCDLPSRSCWPVSPLASLRLDLARLLLALRRAVVFRGAGFVQRDGDGLLAALHLAALTAFAALNSPCLNSCMMRPSVLRCPVDALAMIIILIWAPFFPHVAQTPWHNRSSGYVGNRTEQDPTKLTSFSTLSALVVLRAVPTMRTSFDHAVRGNAADLPCSMGIFVADPSTDFYSDFERASKDSTIIQKGSSSGRIKLKAAGAQLHVVVEREPAGECLTACFREGLEKKICVPACGRWRM